MSDGPCRVCGRVSYETPVASMACRDCATANVAVWAAERALALRNKKQPTGKKKKRERVWEPHQHA